MSKTVSDEEVAQLGCAGFGCGLVLAPILIIAAIVALLTQFMRYG